MTVRSFALRQNPAYRPGDSHALARAVGAVALLLSAACVSNIPRQPVALPPAPPPAPVAPARPSVWRLVPSTLSREYRSEQVAEVRVTSDSGLSVDTTSLDVQLSFRRTTQGASGLIHTATVGGATAVPGLLFPLAFSVPRIQRGVISSAVTAARPTAALTRGCQGAADAVLAVARDFAVHLPDSVMIGTAWSDTGTFDICRDGAVLAVTVSREFVVREFTPAGDSGSLAVDRVIRTSLKGQASRGDDTTRIEGSGSGRMRMILDSRSGSLLSAEGTSDLDLVVRGALKSERARQSARARITSLPPRSR